MDWGTPVAAAPAEGGFVADEKYSQKQDAASEAFQGEFAPENISKHADGGTNDGGCHSCGDPGHFSRDCPDKPAGGNACFRCGAEGHIKSECPQPEILRCKICQTEGHTTSDCSTNRLLGHLTAIEPNEAWEMLKQADSDKDLDDIKSAVLLYAKSFSELTLVDLELALRGADMNTYLIAKEQQLSVTHTIVNLQGEPDQKYVVSLQFSAKPRRRRQDEGWPDDPEENIVRLAEAGFVMDSFVTICRNCGEPGHTKNNCEQEKQEREPLVLECVLCNEQGHRARDCTAPRRKGGKECRSCGETGHMSKDCPSREARTCRNCGSEDHMAKECDQPKNEANMTCRNCNELGHSSRSCPKPTDWSRVECSNCHEKGHSYKRCKVPAAEDAGNGGDSGWGAEEPSTGVAAAGASGGGW